MTHPTHSVLFDQDSGRYLWLKIGMSGLSPRATAAVRELRVYYPRLSYLRYLPAAYQEDKSSREFLERFLSMFETVFSDLESTIEKLPVLYDPGHTPPEFLDWLAQWLDVAVEEDWSVEVKRRLISEASRLYERKGTPAGLADFIEIVTGRRPLIRESFETERPLVLGDALRLGADARLTAQPVEDRPPESTDTSRPRVDPGQVTHPRRRRRSRSMHSGRRRMRSRSSSISRRSNTGGMRVVCTASFASSRLPTPHMTSASRRALVSVRTRSLASAGKLRTLSPASRVFRTGALDLPQESLVWAGAWRRRNAGGTVRRTGERVRRLLWRMTMHKHEADECGVCRIPYFERNNYFHGKTLSARDLFAEQRYFNEKRWLINRAVIGWGVVCGLEIKVEGDCLSVTPGLALDCCGREVLVCERETVHVQTLTGQLGGAGYSQGDGAAMGACV